MTLPDREVVRDASMSELESVLWLAYTAGLQFAVSSLPTTASRAFTNEELQQAFETCKQLPWTQRELVKAATRLIERVVDVQDQYDINKTVNEAAKGLEMWKVLMESADGMVAEAERRGWSSAQAREFVMRILTKGAA